MLPHEDVCDENPLEIPRIEQNRFNLSTLSPDGVKRNFEMFFNEDTSIEWLASLHNVMMSDTRRLLVDIGRDEEGFSNGVYD